MVGALGNRVVFWFVRLVGGVQHVSSRRPLLLALLGLGFGTGLTAQPPGRAAPAGGALLLRQVRVFDPANGTFSDTLDILIRGDRITAVGRFDPPPRGTTILNAGGRRAGLGSTARPGRSNPANEPTF